MAEPKFYIQRLTTPEGNDTSTYPVLLLYSFNGQRLQYYTRERVPNLRAWLPIVKDESLKINGRYPLKKISGRYPFVNSVPGANHIMENLDAIYDHTVKIHADYKRSGQMKDLTVKVFRSLLDDRLKARPEQEKKEICIEGYLTEYLSFIQKKKKHNTFRNVQSNINHFKAFLGRNGLKRQLETIDEVLSERFGDYLRDGRLNNTVVKALQVLKRFLSYCEEKKYLKIVPKIITGTPNDINVIFLDYEETMKLAYCPMPSISLEQVKDVFLFGIFSGLRYGDIAKLQKRHVFPDYIEFSNQKSGKTAIKKVPLTPVSRSIIEKYQNIPGPYALSTISNQKTNDALKKMGKYAGINSIVNISQQNGHGKIIEKSYKKYEVLTCHVSRKSFISISLRLGMKEQVVKSITGHTKNSKAFNKYFEVEYQEKQESMQQIFGKSRKESISELLQKASTTPLTKSEIDLLTSLMN